MVNHDRLLCVYGEHPTYTRLHFLHNLYPEGQIGWYSEAFGTQMLIELDYWGDEGKIFGF